MKYVIIFIIGALPFSSFCTVSNGSEILQGEAIKVFTLANEEYTKALKLMSNQKVEEALDGFKRAADQYEGLIKSGFVNGQVYYNLANSYYRQGMAGKAILFYNKALRLMPRNSALKENIKLVKTEFEDRELTRQVPGVVKTLFFWYFLFNLNEATAFVLFFYIVFMISILVFVFFKFQWLRPIYIGFGAAMIITGITLGAKIATEQFESRGVVITQECKVRYGPGEEYEPKFLIHEGAEFVVKDENDDWYKVYVFVEVRESEDEKETSKEHRVGWLSKNKCGII